MARFYGVVLATACGLVLSGCAEPKAKPKAAEQPDSKAAQEPKSVQQDAAQPAVPSERMTAKPEAPASPKTPSPAEPDRPVEPAGPLLPAPSTDPVAPPTADPAGTLPIDQPRGSPLRALGRAFSKALAGGDDVDEADSLLPGGDRP
jgi:hypothetical protein